jgi:hypothetical protein
MHGGLSTGPKTYEGRARAAANIGLLYDRNTGEYLKARSG